MTELFSLILNNVCFLAIALALASVTVAIALTLAALVAKIALVEIIFTVTNLLILKYKLVYCISDSSNSCNCAESNKHYLAVLRLFGFTEQTHIFILRII